MVIDVATTTTNGMIFANPVVLLYVMCIGYYCMYKTTTGMIMKNMQDISNYCMMFFFFSSEALHTITWCSHNTQK